MNIINLLCFLVISAAHPARRKIMRFSINPETSLHPKSPSAPLTEIPEEESFEVKPLQKDDILDVNLIVAEMFKSSNNPEMNKVLQEFLEDRTLPSDTLGLLLVKNTVPLMVIWPVTSELDPGMYSSLTRLINIPLGRKSLNDTPSLNNPPDINPIYENMFDDKLSDNNHINIKPSDGKTATIQTFDNDPIGDALPLTPDEVISKKNTFYNNFSKDNSTDVNSTNDKHISNQPYTFPLIPGEIESHTNGLRLRAIQISDAEAARRIVSEFLRSLNDLAAIQILELYLKSQTISTPSGTFLLRLAEPSMYLLPLNVQKDRRGKRTLEVGTSSTQTSSGSHLGGDKGPFVHRLTPNPVVEGSFEVVPLDEIQDHRSKRSPGVYHSDSHAASSPFGSGFGGHGDYHSHLDHKLDHQGEIEGGFGVSHSHAHHGGIGIGGGFGVSHSHAHHGGIGIGGGFGVSHSHAHHGGIEWGLEVSHSHDHQGGIGIGGGLRVSHSHAHHGGIGGGFEVSHSHDHHGKLSGEFHDFRGKRSSSSKNNRAHATSAGFGAGNRGYGFGHQGFLRGGHGHANQGGYEGGHPRDFGGEYGHSNHGGFGGEHHGSFGGGHGHANPGGLGGGHQGSFRERYGHASQGKFGGGHQGGFEGGHGQTNPGVLGKGNIHANQDDFRGEHLG